jgi:hypothetical protein
MFEPGTVVKVSACDENFACNLRMFLNNAHCKIPALFSLINKITS